MDDALIVAIFTVIDDVMHTFGHRTHVLAHASDREVLTVAVVAACQFANNHERTLGVMHGMHYLSGARSLSRFNRRLHTLAPWFALALDLLCELFAFGTAAFTLDSLPVPVCHRVRATRCTKVRGAQFYGYCAAKEEKFFGWRLHLVCTGAGVPVGFRVPFGWYAPRELARPQPGVRYGAMPTHERYPLRRQGIQQWR